MEQTYGNIELIVVDDGSPDPLEESVLSVAPEARYLCQSHAGVAAARNRGLREARGELIAFQDSDDVWHPRKLSRQVALLDSQPKVGVVCTGKRSIDETGKVVGDQWKQLHCGDVTEPLFREVFITMPSVVMRRSVANRVGEFDTSLRINSDYQYWLRASLLTKFAAIDLPLIDVRRSSERLTLARTEGAVLRYQMLSDFYNTPEARCSIRPVVAKRVLAKAAFRAGRALCKEGRFEVAEPFLRQSLAFRFTPRAAWTWLRAQCNGSLQGRVSPRLLRRMGRENEVPVTAGSIKLNSLEMLPPTRKAA